MEFRVFCSILVAAFSVIANNRTNSTSPFRVANGRNFVPKKADRFTLYPQSDATVDEQRRPELSNNVQFNWPNYTQYNAAYKYAPPYGPAANSTNYFEYADALQKGQYLRYPTYHYALDQKPIVDTCTLPRQVGNGPYRIPRWHYNYDERRCELFYWSGCCANANNFQTQRQCQEQCENTESAANTVVYVPFTLTFTMRSGEKSAETDEKPRPVIRIQPTVVEEPNVRENLDDLQFLRPVRPTVKSNRLQPIVPSARRQPEAESDGLRGSSRGPELGRINFPEYRLSTVPPTPLVGPITPTRWAGQRGQDEDLKKKTNSNWNSVVHELTATNPNHGEPIKSPFQTTAAKSSEAQPPEVGFRRLIPVQQVQIPLQQVRAVAVSAPVLPPPPPPPTQFVFPAPQTLIPVYPVGPPPTLVAIQPAEPAAPPIQQAPREEPIHPCAYGATATLIPCAVASSTCGGEQFCHVGPSRDATVCCEKPTILDPCSQPLNIGVGGANLRRFFYDPASQQCESYTYRGYQGNENNFLTLADCQSVCQVNPCARGEPFRSTMSVLYCSAMSVCPGGFYCHLGADTRTSVCCPVLGSDPCSQPLENGFGAAPAGGGLVRWYFDVSQQKCLSFLYAGQKGTQNNFLSREDCESFCHPEPPDPCRLPAPRPLTPCIPGPGECGGRHDVWCHVGATQQTTVCCPVEALHRCLQPVERGAGETPSQRWHFDARASRCELFVYNGLKGNQNNFMTREECEANCVPNPCPVGKPLLTADSRLQTCSMSTATSTCPLDHWCHVGPDASTTICCPNASPNPCRLPMSSGDGLANLERFYYDQATKSCRSFQYRGLKGNQNNFLTMKACQLTCQPLDNPCVGQPAKGPNGQALFCSAANRDSCPVNFWCHLGANPETTICCPGATNPCSVPLAPGTGNAGLARWYYNTDDRACVAFQYNGKRGNQNNFLTQAECQRTCPEQLCLLSIDRGACSGRQTRYAYDRQIGECVPFDYTGCGGNLNNFLTMADCVATCGDVGF